MYSFIHQLRRPLVLVVASIVGLAAAVAWARARTAPLCPMPSHACAVPRFIAREGWAPRADAPMARVAVVVLAREADAAELACTLHSFDGAYNGVRRYPYFVLSEVAWSLAARAALAAETDAHIVFVELPASAWSLPQQLAGRGAALARPHDAPQRYYGDTDAYRKMCRLFSGPIFTLPAFANFDYFWRLDAHVRYLCDIEDTDDPIALLERTGGVYAFGMVMQEQMQTVPSLWALASDFAAKNNASAALRTWGRGGAGEWARGCHFWSNMEVGALDFFRGTAYQAWFAAADASGGFVRERWGDAPLHSLGLMMLAPRDTVHYLPELGYQHPPNFRCPRSRTCRRRGTIVSCSGDLFAGCTRNIADGIQHGEGCALDNMLE